MKHSYIFFGAGADTTKGFYRFVTTLVKKITCSEICHCMVAYDGAVLDPSFWGVNYWPLRVVARGYPNLHSVFRVPFRYDIDLDYFSHLHKVRQPMVLPRLLRYLRRGRGPYIYDCLCVVIQCLQAGGADVPRHIATPQALYDWLISKGYPHVRRQSFVAGKKFHSAAGAFCAD